MIRKHIVVLGAALALMAAGEATAQAPADSQRQGEVRRGERQRGERGRKMGKLRRAGMRGMFKGIELTQAQREQMQAVHAKYRPQFESIRESIKPDLDAARSARQRGDSAAARAAFDRTKSARDRAQALHEQERNEIRALLTPEQRTTFDGNAQKIKERMERRGPRQKRGAR